MSESIVKPRDAWRYEIQYGPEGEDNYAWLFDGTTMVGTLRTYRAVQICEALNSFASLQAENAELKQRLSTAYRVKAECNDDANEERHLRLIAEAENERLKAALEGITARYVELAKSGDCGFWNPEEEQEVIAARSALGSNGND